MHIDMKGFLHVSLLLGLPKPKYEPLPIIGAFNAACYSTSNEIPKQGNTVQVNGNDLLKD